MPPTARALVLVALLAGAGSAQSSPPPRRADWLIDPAPYAARVETSPDGREITLENGLIRRTLRLAPDAATIAFDNLQTGESLLRSVRPEARISIDGTAYAIGGLSGQPLHNYLRPEWVDALTPDPAAFHCVGHDLGVTRERFPWHKQLRWMPQDLPWPPPGVSVTLHFAPPEGTARGVVVEVHYELFDGIPLLSKWVTVTNGSERAVVLDRFTAEILAATEPGAMLGSRETEMAAMPRALHVETDYSFIAALDLGAGTPVVRWLPDPLYATQVNYPRITPCLLECAPALGPGVTLAPGGRFESFRVFELVQDSTDRERRGMAVRRMYRTVAPWVTENPLIFHVRSARPVDVRLAIDQAAEVGFELVIMTFGSGFDVENDDPAYLAQLAELAQYAHQKGIALGGYSLLSSRRIDDGNDVVNPATGRPEGFAIFEHAPCLGSRWGQAYFAKLRAAFERTGLDVLEHDGSYPGDPCASVAHPGHAGLPDSQWTQWQTITGFYQWCRARGIYLNVPDSYQLAGANKQPMGYRETNWSLPRAEQEIIERQNIFDGTWLKTPSMGWMFVPLTEYQGGGAAATIEPLHEHLDHYRTRLTNLLGAGVQACFRGPRLYDTKETRDTVKTWVDWYKRHRAILDADLVHGRRADGRDLDWILHVSAKLAERALLVVWNPLDHALVRTLDLDLSLTGLAGTASFTDATGTAHPLAIDGRGHAAITVTVPARGMAFFVFPAASAPINR